MYQDLSTCHAGDQPVKNDWPERIQTSYFIGPYNLHYLLFPGIGALLCHHPYWDSLFGTGAVRPVKKAIVDLPIPMKRNSKLTSGNSSSPLGAQNKNQADSYPVTI